MLLIISMVKKLLDYFKKRNYKKANQEEFKAMLVYLIVGLIRKT